MELYQRIKQRREELELSQEDLAKRLGYRSRSTIAKIESGTNDIPQSKISAFAKALETSEAWLMGYNDSSDSYTEFINSDSIAFEITPRSLMHSPSIYEALCEYVKNFMLIDKNAIYTDGKRSYNNVYEFLIDNNTSFEQRAMLLNAIIDFAIIDTQKHKLNIFMNHEINHRHQLLTDTYYNCLQLNLDGLQKVNTYSKDIASMKSYVKLGQWPPLNPVNERCENAAKTTKTAAKIAALQSENYLNAAHDMGATSEQKAHADSIMEDDSEWE